jgi:hypothetical protein
MRDVCSCSWKNGTHHPKCEARLLVTCNSCGLLFSTRGCTKEKCNYHAGGGATIPTDNKHLGSSFDEHAAACAEDTARKLEIAIKVLEFYADMENWDDDKFSPTVWHDGNVDIGAMAREALAAIKPLNPTT